MTDKLPVTCQKCGRQIKTAYLVKFKGRRVIWVCQKCVKELTGG